MAPITRKEFYEIAQDCHKQALELARHDQSRVNLELCREFNQWLTRLKTYDQLVPAIGDMPAARPINRWHLIGASFVLWTLVVLFLGNTLGREGVRLVTLGATVSMILLVFIPEELYGTTVELLEGKLLRVVETLEEMLLSGRMEFSEAAFFQVKEHLEAARRELRQQIHLAHN